MSTQDASAGMAGLSERAEESYSAYLAGRLFNQHEITGNVLLKEAVWRKSKGRFNLVLPQSKELRQLEIPDLSAYLRNEDLHQVVKADIFIALFDGSDVDSGTVVEFMLAKMLGKPSVIIRTDSRHLGTSGLDDPYNLMLKNWPRTQEVNIDSLIDYTRKIAEARQTFEDSDSESLLLEAELAIVRTGIDELAVSLIEALNIVIGMESPYPPALQEAVYQAVRYTPGAGFDQLLTEDQLNAIMQRLTQYHTL